MTAKTVFEELLEYGVPRELAVKQLIEYIRENDPGADFFPDDVLAEIRTRTSNGPRWRADSMTRVISHAILAASYQANDPKANPLGKSTEVVLSLNDLKSFVSELYREKYNENPKWPAESTLQQLASDLRNGKISGLPAIATRGPMNVKTLNSEGKQVSIRAFKIIPRSFDEDAKNKLLEDVPSWVWNPSERQ